jgi:ABC-type polysaccharide/polyol phosphate export permease
MRASPNMPTFFRAVELGTTLGWQDVKQAYRRSAIGPFWITLGMAVQVVSIGTVFGMIFGTPVEDFLPFLASSLVLWSLMSAALSDGSMAFVTSEAMIRQVNIPHIAYVVRSTWKNVIIAGHNIVILPIVLLVFLKPITWNVFLFIPGLILNVWFFVGAAYILGLVTARFRDMQQIISSVLAVLFYVTPVIWQPQLIPPGIAHLLLGLNPMYHFLQLLRLPILGEAPTLENWVLALICALTTSAIALVSSRRYRHKLAYWVS